MRPRTFAFAFLTLGLVAGGAAADWTSTIAASDPLDWYRFDETTGSTAIDYGSAQLNGTYGSGALDATRGIPGLVGTAALFGNQSTVVLNGSDVTGDWSAEFVLDRVGSKQSSVLIRGVPLAVPSTALKLEQYPNTEQIGFTQYGVADYTFSPAVPTPLNQWIDLVYVNHAGAGMDLYLNGVLVGTSSTNITLERYQIGSNSDTVPESPLAIMNAVRALRPGIERLGGNRALRSGRARAIGMAPRGAWTDRLPRLAAAAAAIVIRMRSPIMNSKMDS